MVYIQPPTLETKPTNPYFAAQDLIIGHTEYAPVPGTSPTQYIQKVYTASLLSAMSRANPILETTQLSQPTAASEIPIPIAPNISLSRLALLGASDPEVAWPIFQLIYRELCLPGRPPMMMCMDGLAQAMGKTQYISAKDYQPIHAHDFTLIKFFFDHLSGISRLPNGGAILASTSTSNQPHIPSMNLALSQLEGKEPVQRDPFAKYDERVLGVFDKGGVEVRRIGGVTKEEARGLMEYWARSGVCRQKVDEGFVGEKWSLSGGGCVGELERVVVRMGV
jgi:small subunit ribosomal protein S29